MKNFLKTSCLCRHLFAILILINVGNITDIALAMERQMERKEDDESIKKVISDKILRTFSAQIQPQFEGSETGKGISFFGEGYIYFPKDLTTSDDFLNYVEQSKVPRSRLSIDDYMNTNPTQHKNIIVGSGLLQTTIQPLIDPDFQDSLYVDASKELFPDIVSKFGLEFVLRPDMEKYHGKFDAIYLDNFPGMNHDEIFQAAAIMLKKGGKLMMTYRPEIHLTQEEQKLMVLSVTAKRFTEENKAETRDFLSQIIFKKLIESGFDRPNILKDKKTIRLYNMPYYHHYAYKK